MHININGQKVWFNYHHLYYFYIIENNGGLVKASEELKVGVSALSSQLRQFEEHLGVELFERKNKRLILTATGRVVYEYAHQIFKLGQDLINSINLSKQVETKSLNVGFFNGVPKSLIMDICKDIRNDPTCQLNLIRGKSENPADDLIQKRLDLILINHPLTQSEISNFYMKKIASSPVVICGHKKHKKLISTFPKSLNNVSFMLPLHSERIKNGVENFFKKQNIKVEIFGGSKDITMQKAIAIEGMSLIAAPLRSVQEHLDKGELIEIGNTGLQEEFYVVTSKNWEENSLLKQVISKLEV